MSEIQKSGDNVLRELLEIVGGPAVHAPEDVAEILKAGVPHMLRAQLDMVLGGSSEKTKAFLSNQWLDRALGSASQRIEVSQKIQVLDARALEVLAKVVEEDAIDVDVRVCDSPGRDDASRQLTDGQRADSGAAPAESP